MSSLSYINESGKEVSMGDLTQTCAALCEHIEALKEIALAKARVTGDCAEAGVMRVMAASLHDICIRLFEVKPRQIVVEGEQ